MALLKDILAQVNIDMENFGQQLQFFLARCLEVSPDKMLVILN